MDELNKISKMEKRNDLWKKAKSELMNKLEENKEELNEQRSEHKWNDKIEVLRNENKELMKYE